MDKKLLEKTARQMVQKGKGILAADETNRTAKKRLASIGMESTENTRRQYRDLFLNTPGIEKYLSGVILYDETLWQNDTNGKPFVDILEEKGITPGIKVDGGAKDFPGFPDEKITEGLDGLFERADAYYKHGARFTKWRAVIRITNKLPTETCIEANAHALARYVRVVQEANLVPIVEPEVLLEGNHTIETSARVISKTLKTVFATIEKYKGFLGGTILKTSMALPGSESGAKASPREVANYTVRCLKRSVPKEIPGVVFLSGGQTPEEATANLDAIAALEPLPWEIAFSYARALQGPPMEAWQGKPENIDMARKIFLKRLDLNIKADKGEYEEGMENKLAKS